MLEEFGLIPHYLSAGTTQVVNQDNNMTTTQIDTTCVDQVRLATAGLSFRD